MSKKNNFVKKKRLFFRFLKFWFRLFFHRPKFSGLENIPDEPCIIAGNHCKMHTPIMGECYFPVKKLTWCDAPMFDKKDMKAYAYSVFWGNKPKWYHRLAANVLAPLIAYVMKNADALPVFRDMRVVKTYKMSVDTMMEGNHVLILPECPDEHNEIVNKLNEYFVDVARFYFKRTGKELSFVPMYYAPKIKRAMFGKAIKFDATANIEDERKRICSHIVDEMTFMAKQLPVHTVVPFNNVPKKQYKKSK